MDNKLTTFFTSNLTLEELEVHLSEGKNSVDKLKAKRIIERIKYLTSELKLEDFFTPNYLYDYFSELHGVSKEVAEARKNDFFTKFEIDNFKEVKIGDLSTGMKQKVSLVIS